jgi:hypothetical protein
MGDGVGELEGGSISGDGTSIGIRQLRLNSTARAFHSIGRASSVRNGGARIKRNNPQPIGDKNADLGR